MQNWIGKLELELLHTPDTTFFKRIKNILFGAFMYIIWATVILAIYHLFIPEFKPGSSINFNFSKEFLFVEMCIFAPLFEELLYRVLPLESAKLFNKARFTLLTALLSSVIFGLAHSGGTWAVPVQGVGGLFFCYVYLKNGSSYWSSVLMHFIINFFYFIIYVL